MIFETPLCGAKNPAGLKFSEAGSHFLFRGFNIKLLPLCEINLVLNTSPEELEPFICKFL